MIICSCVISSGTYYAQLARFGLGVELHTGKAQNVRLYLFQKRAQGVNAARPVALGCCAWLVAHHLRNSPSRCPGSLAQQ